MMTATTIKNLKPKIKPYKKADAKVLFVIVTPQGGKRWRFKYRFEGKEKCLSVDGKTAYCRLDRCGNFKNFAPY